MRIQLRVTGLHEAQRMMLGLHERQIPFAMMNAINDTAFNARDAERKGVTERFIIRRPWVREGVWVPPGGKAKKDNLRAILELDPRRGFMAKFEPGGVKAGSHDMPIAIPTENLRPAITDIPPLRMYPKNLGLVARHDVVGIRAARAHVTRRGVTQLQGKYRTFVLDPSTMFGVQHWGVYRRYGKKGKGAKYDKIEMIWAYRSKIKIPKRLEFYATAQETADKRFQLNWTKRWREAVASARGR